MEQQWQGSIELSAPVSKVYRYLADFPRHCEWAQTLDRMEQKQSGDDTGIGASYLTYERRAFQADRRPKGPLPEKAFAGKTLCEVTTLDPDRRIAWHAHPVPRMGVSADLAFDLAPMADGGTRLTQTIHMHQAWLMVQLFSRMFFKMRPEDMEAKAVEQWQASLRNIKSIVEQGPVEFPAAAVA